MPASTARARVRFLYSRLYKRFGPQHWWPAQTRWEMMVGAILTQNTAWTNVEKAIASLKQADALSLQAIARMPRRRLEKLVRPSGYFRQKAKRLQEFAKVMLRDQCFFRALCDKGPQSSPFPPLRPGGPAKASVAGKGEEVYRALRGRLLSLHGVGPETADSILLYAGDYPMFVVDAYTRRIGDRMGLFKTDDYHKVQTFFEENLPRNSKLYNEMHALIVRLGKEICTSRKPRCGICPVRGICDYGRELLR